MTNGHASRVIRQSVKVEVDDLSYYQMSRNTLKACSAWEWLLKTVVDQLGAGP
jgi:hypothetical protein